MNPLDIFLSWQSIVLAVGVSIVTQVLKQTLDIFVGKREIRRLSSLPPPSHPKPRGPHDPPSLPMTEKLKNEIKRRDKEIQKLKARQVGKDKRRGNAFANRVLLPLVPIVLGSAAAVLIPMRPDGLIEYVTEHAGDQGGWIYAGWGAVAGVFSDYLYVKVKKAAQDMQVGMP